MLCLRQTLFNEFFMTVTSYMSALRLSLSILQYLAPGAGVGVDCLPIALDSTLIPGTIDLR